MRTLIYGLFLLSQLANFLIGCLTLFLWIYVFGSFLLEGEIDMEWLTIADYTLFFGVAPILFNWQVNKLFDYHFDSVNYRRISNTPITVPFLVSISGILTIGFGVYLLIDSSYIAPAISLIFCPLASLFLLQKQKVKEFDI